MRVTPPAGHGLALFVDWVHALLDDAYGVTQYGTGGSAGSRSFSLPDGANVVLAPVDGRSDFDCEITDAARSDAFVDLIGDALSRAAAGDLGTGVWWKAGMSGRYGILSLRTFR